MTHAAVAVYLLFCVWQTLSIWVPHAAQQQEKNDPEATTLDVPGGRDRDVHKPATQASICPLAVVHQDVLQDVLLQGESAA